MWSSLIIPVRPVVCDDFVKCRTCWLHQLPEARESNPTESDLFLLFLFPLPGSHFSISSKSPLVRGGLVTFPMFPTVQTSSNHCWNFWRPSSRQDGAQELTDAQRGQRRLRCRFQDHLDDAQIKAMKPWKPWKMDGELCLDSIFRKKNVELTHWTMKHIGKFTLNKTRNWLRTGGLSNQPIYWGVVGCFMGYINTMKWGSPRKNWGSFIYLFMYWHIVVYWCVLFICVYLSSNPWWNPGFCSPLMKSQLVLRTGAFPDPSCAITATTPRGIRRTTTCEGRRAVLSWAWWWKNVKRSKDPKIWNYKIPQLLKISSCSILQWWLLKSPRQDTAATSN